jgi:spoIIIJ-associated protein
VDIGERTFKPKEVVIDIVNLMNLRSRVTCWEDEEEIHVDVWGEDLGILIGRGGATLQALQELVAAIVKKNCGESRRIVVDVERYRERKRQKLREFAERMAEKALVTGRPVRLPPMTARERKIVHDTLKEMEGVESKSEGEEPRRMVVIRPLQQGNRRPR